MNYFTIRPLTWKWFFRRVSPLLLICTFGFGGQALAQDFTLVSGVEETGEYGWRWGSNNNRESVEAEFEQVESDIVLSYRGYDVDNVTEVSVLLNGEFLSYMPLSGNNSLGGIKEIEIAAEDQQPGTNTLSFLQRVPGYIGGE